ncbi:MAG: MarR family transcriptional regulator [Geminicoccaceae bacterium]|nr:MarR family transcriptional regulator [Geminicoccaceae bacterium]
MQNDAPSLPFVFLLHDTARLLRRRFDHRARELGLTRAQWQALVILKRSEGINQAGLAELMEVEPITLCRLIDRMEEGGWVERRPDPHDRRARQLFMTEKAKPIVARMRVIAEAVQAEMLDGLDEAERAALEASLARLRTNLSDSAPARRAAND